MHAVIIDSTQSSNKSPWTTVSQSSTHRVWSFRQCASPWQPQNIVHDKWAVKQPHNAVEQGVSVAQPYLIISSTSGGATLTFGFNVTGIKHLVRSSRSHPNSTGSNAGWSELRADFHMVQSECAAALRSPRMPLEKVGVTSALEPLTHFFYPSFATRFLHGPQTCSTSPSFGPRSKQQWMLSLLQWCHLCPRLIRPISANLHHS